MILTKQFTGKFFGLVPVPAEKMQKFFGFYRQVVGKTINLLLIPALFLLLLVAGKVQVKTNHSIAGYWFL
jgi:hypothetical protein